jgi:hypothetical protein
MGSRQIYNIPAPPKELNTGTQERTSIELMAIFMEQSILPRKAVCISSVTVPQTDTGRWVEYTKARE